LGKTARIDTTEDGQPADDAAPSPPTPPFGLPWPPLALSGVQLRPWGATPKDPEYLAAAWAIDDIARFCAVPDDRSREAAKAWIDAEPARRDAGTALDLCITKVGEPEVIFGEIGLVLAEPARRWAELGFWLFPGVRGEGRATAAVDAFTDWVLSRQGITRVFARIHPDNPRSAKVVERCGYQHVGDLADGVAVWAAEPQVPRDLEGETADPPS
jgi:RimJ/RimL family protein N-acetyltransferase